MLGFVNHLTSTPKIPKNQHRKLPENKYRKTPWKTQYRKSQHTEAQIGKRRIETEMNSDIYSVIQHWHWSCTVNINYDYLVT